MTAGPDLAGLADRPDTVVLTQASTPTEARLIRERIAAVGGSSVPPVSLGPAGEGLPVPAPLAPFLIAPRRVLGKPANVQINSCRV